MAVRVRRTVAIVGLSILAVGYLLVGIAVTVTVVRMGRDEIMARAFEPLRHGLLLTGAIYSIVGSVCLWGAVALGRKHIGARRVAIAAVILTALSIAWDFFRAVAMGLDMEHVVETGVLATVVGVITVHLIQERRQLLLEQRVIRR